MQRYYPWVVIGIAFLTVAVAFGTRNAFAVFLVAVIEEFHWSRGLALGALMLGSIMWTLSAPVIGYLLDRLGPRIVLPGGAIVMAIGFIVSGFAHSVLEFYIGMGVFMGVGFAALPMTSQATFLSNWFIRKRGMAIGVAASGIGFGNSSGRALDAMVGYGLRLAGSILHTRGFAGTDRRAAELFFSTPKTGRDESRTRLRRYRNAR